MELAGILPIASQHLVLCAASAGTRPVEEGPYGEPVEPTKAPEAISRAVASLPPEQMFDLMKQMKVCLTRLLCSE